MTSSHPLTDRPSPQRVLSDVALAVVVGWVAWFVSCLLVATTNPDPLPPFTHSWFLMSQAPFDWRGAFPHRVLVPLLAWLFGQGGEGYVRFTDYLHIAMLATTFFVARRYRGAVVDGALVTLAIAITAPVQLYKQHWVGYVDPMCYTLFLLMLVTAHKPFVFWGLFLANLFNHELAAFLLPWLWFLRRRQDSRWRLDIACIGVVLAIYAAFYFAVKAAVKPTFSVDYFMSHPLFPGGTFVVLNLAAVHLTVAFGPVLAVLAWHQHTRSNGVARWNFWLVLLGVTAIFCIAFDWARHSNLILLPLVLAATRFLQSGSRARFTFAGLLALSVFLFWLVPPWSPSAWPTRIFADTKLLFTTGVAFDGPGEGLDIGFGGLDASVGRWLPQIWKPLLVVHLIGATIWLAGWAYARRVRTEPGSTSPLS